MITGPGRAEGRWTPEDDSLVREVPADTEVHRVPSPEPSQEGRGEQLERWLGMPSPWSRWWVEGSVRLGTAAGRQSDLVYTWMQPYQTAAAGAKLAKALGKPWVADLGDPWAFDEMIAYPTRFHRRREARRMRSLLGQADAVVMSTPEAARRVLEEFPEFSRKPVCAIPNGYEPTDFEGPLPGRTDGLFRIVHTGYLHTDLGLRYRKLRRLRRLVGGMVPGVDVFPRSHVYLLEAIEQLLGRRPDLRGQIEVMLAGVLSAGDRTIAEQHDFVTMPGYVTHASAVSLMRTADLLFLPMHELEEGRATIVPGKTYEYLAADVPILAAVPDGDVRDVLETGGRTTFCRPRDVDALALAVERAVDSKTGAGVPAPTPSTAIERYSYPRLADELSGLFDSVLERR